MQSKEACFKKYALSYADITDARTELPKPNAQSMLIYRIDQVKKTSASKKSKMPSLKKLKRITQSIERLFEILADLDPTRNLNARYAHDQCIAFLGQLFIDLNSTHQLVLKEPTFSVWDTDFVNTIQIRHQKLMHNVVLYDESLVSHFVKESVLPWQKNFKALNYIVQLNQDGGHALVIEDDSDKEVSVSLVVQYYNALGLAYTQLTQWSKAEEYLLKSHEYSKQLSDYKTNDGVACVMHNLCDIYRARDQWQDARDWMRQCWLHRKANLVPVHPYYVSTLIHLGMCAEKLGDDSDALFSYQYALEICRENELDSRQALASLADFHADQQNYLESLVYYRQLDALCTDKTVRLYYLQSMIWTHIENGEHEKALDRHAEMADLFLKNKAYFKSCLGESYRRFEQDAQGPFYLLDLMGNSEEALRLMSSLQSLTQHHKEVKLRLLRNVGDFEQARELVEALRADGHASFTSEVIYAEVLIQQHQAKEGIQLLSDKCEEALANLSDKKMSQTYLSAFNSLCLYYLKNDDPKRAASTIDRAFIIIDGMQLRGMSSEVFVTFINYFRSYAILQDMARVKAMVSKYEPLVLQAISRDHSDAAINMLVELICLFSQNQGLDLAEKFLSTIMSAKLPMSEASHQQLMSLHIDFSYQCLQSGLANYGITQLASYLNNHCEKESAAVCSFHLAKILSANHDMDLLCYIVDEYSASWNESLAVGSLTIYGLYKTISNFSFLCCNHSAEIGDLQRAIDFSQHCLLLCRKIFVLLQEEKPSGKVAFEQELFKQYWRLPMAVGEFMQLSSQEMKFYFVTHAQMLRDHRPQKMTFDQANRLNQLFFGGDLQIAGNQGVVAVTAPQRWQKFLLAFANRWPSIAKLGQSTPLQTLDMTERKEEVADDSSNDDSNVTLNLL